MVVGQDLSSIVHLTSWSIPDTRGEVIILFFLTMHARADFLSLDCAIVDMRHVGKPLKLVDLSSLISVLWIFAESTSVLTLLGARVLLSSVWMVESVTTQTPQS